MRDMNSRHITSALLPFGIFAFIGTIFLCVGLMIGLPDWLQLGRYARAEGSVIDYRRSGEMTYPIVQFVTPDGRRWEFEEDVGSNPPDVRLEQKVDVRYDPANPRSAFINSFMVLWFLPGMFVLMGGIFAIIGLAGIISMLRHRHAA